MAFAGQSSHIVGGVNPFGPGGETAMQIYDPRTGRFVDVVDITAAVAAVTQANPLPQDVIDTFWTNRLTAWRPWWRFLRAITRVLPLVSTLWPEKIAAGVLFNKATRKDGFDAEASIYWYVVAPPVLSGSSDNLVYSTSTNLAADGPEALLMFVRRGAPTFCVAESNRQFVVIVPYNDPIFTNHLITHRIGDTDYQTLYIANITTGSGTSYVNNVYLFNPTTSKFDLVHNRAYTTNFPGTTSEWGPIIEVPNGGFFGTTSTIGYAEATLVTLKGGVRRTALLNPGNTDFGTCSRWQFDVDNNSFIPNSTMLAN